MQNPDRLSVLLLARELGQGGSERQLTEMAKGLDPNRFCPYVGYFRPGIRSDDLEEKGIPCFQIGVRSFAQRDILLQAQLLKKFLRNNRIDIVHTFDYPLTCFAVPIARAVGVPIVLSSQRGHRQLIPAPYRAAVRVTDLIVDGIVVNCLAMQRHLIDEEDAPRRKVQLCHNGIDVTHFKPGVSLNDFSQPDRPLVLGVVAALRPEKRLDLLIRAAAYLQPMLPDLQVMIAGSGSELEALQVLARELGILHKCVFHPAESDVRGWLNRISIFVLPSSTEGLSNSLMEAMACGCGVVASNVGGNPELVIDGETGLLFESGNLLDLANKILRLAENRKLRESLASKALQRIREQFTLEKSAARMAGIYEHFIASKRCDRLSKSGG